MSRDRNKRRAPRSFQGGPLIANVNGLRVRAGNHRQMIERLEQLAEEAETENERLLLDQHAEHYRKEMNDGA